MKLPYLLLALGVSGLAISVYAVQGGKPGGDEDVQTTYYANGHVRCRATLHDGRREGAATSFYSDGKKMSEGTYSAGKMEGEWNFWNDDGALDRERTGNYHEGEKQSAIAAGKLAGE